MDVDCFSCVAHIVLMMLWMKLLLPFQLHLILLGPSKKIILWEVYTFPVLPDFYMFSFVMNLSLRENFSLGFFGIKSYIELKVLLP